MPGIYKHIGINGSMLDEHPTGVGVYTINIINHLSALYENGPNRLTVFTPTSSRLHKNMKIVPLSQFLRSSQFGKLAAFSRFLWNTLYYPVKSKNFDLLLSPTTHGSITSKSQIITIHDLLSLRFNNISFHQRLYYRYFLPLIVARSKKVVAVSETTKKDIIHFLKCPESKIQVIYNGYDKEIYNTQQDSSGRILETYGVENFFLAIGPTYPHKNFSFLIESYADLPLHIRKTHPLVIAGGKKNYIQKLKLQVKDNFLEKYVHFLGYVPPVLMPDLYKEAKLLIFPSLYEGFGFPLLEAMASGCPIIASDISSIPEICEHAVLYFNPYDKDSLKHQIHKLISNDTLQSELVQKGLEQVKKFSWSDTARKLKCLIEDNIKNP